MKGKDLVLGIDPGTVRTGYALVEEADRGPRVVDYGAIQVPRGLSVGEKLALIFSALDRVIQERAPTAVAVEEVFFAHNARSALLLGQARGVAILAAAQAGLPVYEYAPLQVKQAVAGYGRAPKRQLQEALKLLLELPQVPEPEDAADALAVAVCHLASRKLEALLDEAKRGDDC